MDLAAHIVFCSQTSTISPPESGSSHGPALAVVRALQPLSPTRGGFQDPDSQLLQHDALLEQRIVKLEGTAYVHDGELGSDNGGT